MKREKSQSKLRKEADKIFSLYIRKKYSDDFDRVVCYTCGKIFPSKQIQNGHFVKRQYLATRYSEDNCRPQCVGCNIFGDGKTVEFAKKLEEEKKGIVKKLYQEAQKIERNFDYQKIIDTYKEKIKSL